MPFSDASLRASGEIRIRPDLGAAAAAVAGAGAAGAGAGAAGAGASGVTDATAGVAGASAAFAGAPAGATTFSPGWPIAQSAAPSGTWEPAGTKTARSVPSKKLSSSIVALSVSISASMSPDLMLSPSFLSHLTSVPTVMVSLSFGISMILAMGEVCWVGVTQASAASAALIILWVLGSCSASTGGL